MKVCEVLEKAVEFYGPEEQLLMVFEELGELMTAIVQWNRGRIGALDVCEEHADAIVMLCQLPFILNAIDPFVEPDWFSKTSEEMAFEKIRRLEQRMEGGE